MLKNTNELSRASSKPYIDKNCIAALLGLADAYYSATEDLKNQSKARELYIQAETINKNQKTYANLMTMEIMKSVGPSVTPTATNWYNMAKCFHNGIQGKNKNLARAHHCYKEAIQINPKLAAAHHDLGFLYLLKRDQRKACDSFYSAFNNGSARSLPHYLRHKFFSCNYTPTAINWNILGVNFTHRKNNKPQNCCYASACFLEAIKLELNNDDLAPDTKAWCDYGEAKLKKKGAKLEHFLHAKACFDYVLEKDSDYTRAHYLLGKIYQEGLGVKTNPEQAKMHYEKAQADFSDAWVNLQEITGVQTLILKTLLPQLLSGKAVESKEKILCMRHKDVIVKHLLESQDTDLLEKAIDMNTPLGRILNAHQNTGIRSWLPTRSCGLIRAHLKNLTPQGGGGTKDNEEPVKGIPAPR